MRKLNLMICEPDETYLRSLENCLMVNSSRRFHIDSFTSIEGLIAFMNLAPGRPDLLLVSESMADTALPISMADKVLLLTEEKRSGSPGEAGTLFKYQHIDGLLSGILQALATSAGDIRLPAGNGLSRTISVCSSSGGSGKTSVAVSCSVLCARRGLRTFYLNLEKVPSTGHYFTGRAERNLSHVIYYLKEYKRCWHNLAVKLEGARCIDPTYGVHSFLPPESLMDLDEMGWEETGILLEELKKSGQYDFLFVDLPAGLSRENLVVLEASDCILRVESPVVQPDSKGELFMKEFRLQQERQGMELERKMVTVLNRHPGNREKVPDQEGDPVSDCVIVGEYAELQGCRTGWLKDGGSAFAVRMAALLDRYMIGGPAGMGKQAGGDRAG